MKITRTRVEVFDFDYEKELKRLHSCFKGKQLRRQLDILSAVFHERNFKKASKLINSLPYCKKHECWEHEFLGGWSSIFNGSQWGETPISTDVSYDF